MTECNILFTSVGRRVALIRHFQSTLQAIGLSGNVIGVDITAEAPAFHVVDKARTVCRIDDPRYIPALLDICKKEHVRFLFPLIDTDLLKLSESKAQFADIGTTAVVSDPELVAIALDKQKTHDFFISRGVGTPHVYSLDDADSGSLEYPLFIKPLDGNASKGTFTIRNPGELLFFKDYVPRPILQEYLHGMEFTLDVLFDFRGRVRCVVPRQRLEVRAGEVSKAVIADDPGIVAEGRRVAGLLPGGCGCINMQCFLTPDGSIRFVEINPRFGGGFPLSLRAGADFPQWIIQMALGNDPGDVSDAYRKNVYMLRYDDAVFLEGLPSPQGRP